MSIAPVTEVDYPDSDGEPMSDNTVLFRWIQTLVGGLQALYRDRPDVFVAGDHLIYPVEGDNRTRVAPDAYVAFGRPPHDRGSYRVWEEGGVFPQVVFEVWSPSNSEPEVERKRLFYERFGAEEFYYVRPDRQRIDGWLRDGGELVPVEGMNGFASPRTGAQFWFDESDMFVAGPDGRRFAPTADVARERDEAERERDEIALERDEIAGERDEIALERDEIARRAAALAAKLRVLGIDPDAP